MEVLFKTIHLLCLSSITISLQLTPSLNIKSPIGLELAIGELNTHHLNDVIPQNNKPISYEQCFCLPNNPNSRPVISHLYPGNQDTERIVVYLYKSNGAVTLYIPNKNKQDLLPELNFDADDGDILIPITTESIIDLFDTDIIKPQHNVATFTEETLVETEFIDTEINEPQTITGNSNSDNLITENVDTPLISPDHSLLPDHIFIDGQEVPINTIFQPSNHIPEVGINDSEPNQIINAPDVDHNQQPVNLITPINPQVFDIIPGLNDLDQDSSITVILPSQVEPLDIQSNVNKHKPDNFPNLHDFNQLQPIIPLLPPKPQSSPESILQLNPYDTDSMANNYITFYDWFEKQLRIVLLYNLETPSKVIELRERIKKVLQDNGMHLSVKGIVTDSNGKLMQMNNIKLRPILIGGQSDPENFLGHQTNLGESIVSYVQFIEIILVAPPKLLGTLVMGTVYLPRNVAGAQKINLPNTHQDIDETKHPVGCATCKPSGLQHNPSITVPYGQYFGLPLRRNFNDRKHVFGKNLQYKKPEIPSAKSHKPVSDKDNRSGLGGIFGGLLEDFGITPTLVANPTRRLLGGILPTLPKPGPKSYPNDVLPGFRIIGGNAATSSGTPLVNKGRSGFQKPSLIV